MKFIFSLFFLSFHYVVLAQNPGILVVKTDNQYIDSVITKKNNSNRISNSISGFRIQLFSGNERANANAIKTKFLKLYPNQPAYISYQQPYFKIRVGNFRTKLEAKIFYNTIKSEFSDCIIVTDKIALQAQN